MKMLLASCFVLWLFLPRSECKDPCDRDGHRRIPNIGLRYIFFKVPPGDRITEDSRLLESWYYVGNEKMPEHPPHELSTCGTQFPIWLNGTHPIDDKIINRTCCTITTASACSYKHDVRIKYCPTNKFYLYYLKPTTSASEGYCFGIGVNGTVTTYVAPKPSVTYEVRKHPGSFTGFEWRVNFICNFKISSTAKLVYQVSWLRQGVIWYTTATGKDSTDEAFLLTEKIFTEKGFSLGEKISCVVRAYSVLHGPPGKLSAVSNDLYVGIKILSPNPLVIDDTTSIRLQPTIPIGCSGNINSCFITLVAYTPDPHTNKSIACSGTVLKSCQIKIHNQNYSSEINIPVTVAPSMMYQYKDVITLITLKTTKSFNNEIWNNYKLPSIPITIKTTKNQDHYGRTCYAHVDPHILTFDGRKYDNQHLGVFIMYRNTKHDAEIQIKQSQCYPRITCPCGLAVRINDDRYVIDICGKRNQVISYKECFKKYLTVKKLNEKRYQIIFPYGTFIDVSILGKYMNIDIKPSKEDDKGNSNGLCGTLDGDCNNDFHFPNGSKTSENGRCSKTLYKDNQPNQFITAWKIQDQTINDMFSTNFTLKTGQLKYNFCKCTSNLTKIECDPRTAVTCTSSGSIIGDHNCDNQSRKRRSVPIVEIHEEIQHSRQERALAKNWTEAEAIKYCTSFMQQSPIFAHCSKVPSARPQDSLDTCVMDIMITGGTEWSYSAMEIMRMSCLSELERNATLWETTPGKPSIAEVIADQACPFNCSSLGKCVKGRCQCQKGYGGHDCSLDVTRAPTISGLLDNGLCDERHTKCDNAYVYGHSFADEHNLTCRLEEFTISMYGTRQQKTTHYIHGELETFIEVACPIHKKRHKRSTLSATNHTDFVSGYTISVSNDGNNFQPGHDLFVYNSECQIVTNVSGAWRFTLKNGYCFIENKCVLDGVRNKNSNCSRCSSKVLTTSWTTDPSIQGCEISNAEKIVDESNGKSYLWVIGVVAGFVCGVVIAVIVVIRITKNRGKKKVSDSKIISSSSEIRKLQ